MLDLERLRKILYAHSPFNLASKNDDKYRDAVDDALEYYVTVEVKNVR